MTDENRFLTPPAFFGSLRIASTSLWPHSFGHSAAAVERDVDAPHFLSGLSEDDVHTIVSRIALVGDSGPPTPPVMVRTPTPSLPGNSGASGRRRGGEKAGRTRLDLHSIAVVGVISGTELGLGLELINCHAAIRES